MFLVEADSYHINEESDYKLANFNTLFHKKLNPNDKTRIICLTKIDGNSNQTFKLRPDLMSDKFPSIWIEVENKSEKNVLICGYYREWSNVVVLTSGPNTGSNPGGGQVIKKKKLQF